MSPETYNTTAILYNQLLFYFLLGIGVFIVSMIGIILLFGWSIKQTLDKGRGFAIIILFAIITPLTISTIYNSTPYQIKASANSFITNVKVKKTNDSTAQITISLSSPAIVFLEYTDKLTDKTKTILPTNSSLGVIYKTFIIDNISQNGGSVIVVINGQRQFINGQPIKIP